MLGGAIGGLRGTLGNCSGASTLCSQKVGKNDLHSGTSQRCKNSLATSIEVNPSMLFSTTFFFYSNSRRNQSAILICSQDKKKVLDIAYFSCLCSSPLGDPTLSGRADRLAHCAVGESGLDVTTGGKISCATVIPPVLNSLTNQHSCWLISPIISHHKSLLSSVSHYRTHIITVMVFSSH